MLALTKSSKKVGLNFKYSSMTEGSKNSVEKKHRERYVHKLMTSEDIFRAKSPVNLATARPQTVRKIAENNKNFWDQTQTMPYACCFIS